jgi:hypothetical protein
MKISRFSLPLVVLIIVSSCSKSESSKQSSFITTLGNDTLVVEQFSFSENQVDAQVLMRSPVVRYYKQTLKFGSDGSFESFVSEGFKPDDLNADPIEKQALDVEGDSLIHTVTTQGETQSRSFEFDSSIIPWIDMVHWPYEVATRRVIGEGISSVDQLMFTGRNAAIFEIRQLDEDSVSIKHPFRGTMYASIDTEGGLLNYDATSTTRKLIVKRGGGIDLMNLVEKFSDRPIGSLSGEGESLQVVLGANISFTFGQPARRGRELFGNIVPWGERWRTGANRATHFKTDTDLSFAELRVPAGEYTLFTIPEPDGGTLIINKQTGQNGNSYDENQDLGRVPMTIMETSENVELFTILAVEKADLGVMQLKWGETVFEVAFEVKD